MQPINERNEDRRRHDDQEEVAQQEVGTPEGHLHDLDDVFTSGLREGRRSEATAVPLSGPPCSVSFIVLVFTREEYGNEDLLNGTLDSDDGDDTKHGMRCIPGLEEPL